MFKGQVYTFAREEQFADAQDLQGLAVITLQTLSCRCQHLPSTFKLCQEHNDMSTLKEEEETSGLCEDVDDRSHKEHGANSRKKSRTYRGQEIRNRPAGRSRRSTQGNQRASMKVEPKVEIEDNKLDIKDEELWYGIVESDADERLELQDLDGNKPSGYQCNLCGKTLAVKENLKVHMRIHSGEKPFTCHICGKQFRWSAGLARHLKEVHAGIKEHGCDICGRMFAAKATRDGHRRIHTGERPYVCDSCGKAFKTQATLYIHIKIHSDLFPFMCKHCGKKFRRHQDLVNHVTTHTGEKPHVCDVCGKGFGVKNDMRRHRRIHSDEKPYVCASCGLRFAQKRYLKNHDKNHHRRENVSDL